MMTKQLFKETVGLGLPTDIITDNPFDTVTGLLLIAGLIWYFADALINNTDVVNQFVSLVQETSLDTAINNAKLIDLSSLDKNNILTNQTYLPVNAELNFNSIHLIIFHAKDQLVYLTTLNPDLSINIHEQATIDGNTDVTELNNISDRFFNSFNTLIDTIGRPISIQTTIITKTDLDFWHKSEPFIPILHVLTEYPFNLSAYILDTPSVNLQLQNVGLNLFALEVFETQLIHQNGLLNNILTILENTNLDSQPAWSYYQAHGQLWRYIVTIRRAYFIMG